MVETEPAVETEAAVGTRREQLKAERRRQLLDAGARLIADRGFLGVRLDDLGAAVGISGPAVYRHFASKEALLVELLVGISRRLLAGGRAVFDEYLDSSDEAEPHDGGRVDGGRVDGGRGDVAFGGSPAGGAGRGEDGGGRMDVAFRGDHGRDDGRDDGGARAHAETALAALVDFHLDFALGEPELIRIQDRDLDNLPASARRQVRRTQREYVEIWVDVLRRLLPALPEEQARVRAHAVFGLLNSTPHSATTATAARARPVLRDMALSALAVAPR
ncbi:TetR/AcrR family transcriptional regulator [Nocardia shimofusensis]|uniref:TetR/AcrR family transcriptional regulator n=1 Tax=Nocardia shimofusensis TaxID=228596 RepID=UPI00082DB6C6|nr:TetR family transcriptional regulator [Nocardia shimofusensis]